LYGYDIQQVIDNRILEKETGMGSARARIISYEVFKMKFPENPWFGVGPETKADVVRLLQGVAPLIHVGYLSYLYYYGMFGSLLLFLVLFFLLKLAWSVGQKHAFWGSLYGILTFCFANMTFVYFNFSEVGMVLAVVYLKYYSDKDSAASAEAKVNLALK
jgi:O-antigen ligase